MDVAIVVVLGMLLIIIADVYVSFCKKQQRLSDPPWPPIVLSAEAIEDNAKNLKLMLAAWKKTRAYKWHYFELKCAEYRKWPGVQRIDKGGE